MPETATKRRRKLKAPFPAFGGKGRIAPYVKNAKRERIWFNGSCLAPEQRELFA